MRGLETMNERHLDTLETRDPGERERALYGALPGLFAHARENAPACALQLDAVDCTAAFDAHALARIPLMRKSDLPRMQGETPPFGGLATLAPGECARVFASPGPVYEPQGRRDDFWRMSRALFAAGFRAGDLVHNTFSYHFTPAGAMLESGAHALGCAVFPAGVGQSAQQVRAIADLRPSRYVGTPSFLNIILDKAAELGADASSISRGLVSGEALAPSLRDSLAERGVQVLQCYATADLGLIAYESAAMEGMIVDEGVILEIVRPGTGDPLPPGEVGEVVVTSLNADYPLIRFATGDLSALMPGVSPCGRSNVRICGWMGRADQTTKVKGMFVHPAQIAEVLRRHPEVTRGRLVVDNHDNLDVMTLRCEAGHASEALAGSLANSLASTLREVCKLRGEVELVEPGVLPNDGKVIEDIRTYE